MSEGNLITLFAPAERLSGEELNKQRDCVQEVSLVTKVLDIMPVFVTILNEHRQILFANKAFIDYVKRIYTGELIGSRVGESLMCIHSDTNPGGCGTSEFCKECGAVNAMLKSQEGIADTQECRILQKNGEALDLMVWGTPFELNGKKYTIFSAVDKSDEKRRRALERIFFHDILNTAGGLFGYTDLLLESATDEETKMYAEIIFQISSAIIEEIEAQKDLAAAENNELSLKLENIESLNILSDVASAYKNHEVARHKTILISSDSEAVAFQSDRTLLRRVIGNMTKNALEASSVGSTITLSSKKMEDGVLFSVHNPGYIPRNVQLQIFQRSFSTKGKGRGLGTYSIKLLGEKYLKGKVSFMTDPEQGTTFMISLPFSLEC